MQHLSSDPSRPIHRSLLDGAKRALIHLPVPAVVILCCGLPLGWVVWQIAQHPAAWVELRMDGFRLQLMGRTLLYNGAAAVVATLLALPAALVLGRGRGWMAGVLWFILPVSLLMPSMAYSYGWSQFFRLMEIRLEPAGAGDVLRCVWSLATWLWPLPAAVIGLALRRMDTQVQQQALLDGVLWRMTFRQLAGPIVAGAAIVMVLGMQEYAVYEPTGISVIATEVRMVFDTGAFSSMENPITAPIIGGGVDLPAQPAPAPAPAPAPDSQGILAVGTMDQAARASAAVVTAIPLLLTIGLLAGIAVWGIARSSAAENVETGPWPKALSTGWLPVVLAGLVVIVALVVPTVSMVQSMRRPIDFIRMWQAVSPQMIGSLNIAMATGLFALALALLATARRWRWLLILAVISFLIGGQLLAIAQIRIYNRPWLGWIYNAWPIVVMAYLARFGWVALLAADVSWTRPWRQLRELAAVDGAGPLRTMWHVIWPIIWPLCAAAGVLLMILALTEVPATVLLAPQRPPMIVPLLMTWVHMLRNDDMLEGSLLLMSVVMILALLAAALIYTTRRVARGMGRQGG